MNRPSEFEQDSVSSDLAGKSLGDYLLLRRLGSGGMADVYLAQQQSLQRLVALKVLRKNLANDSSYVQRFQNEAQAAAALVHPNIVQVFEVNCQNGYHYIAQEYVQGQNLKMALKRNGAFEVKEALSIMRQVANALDKASKKGITHRDIKPENIMLTGEGEAKVADFGLARIELKKGITIDGVTMGTPLYMSPEQIESNRVDPRSDIYSFGITCYQMLSGNPPFDADTVMAIAWQHVNHPPPDILQVRPDVPA